MLAFHPEGSIKIEVQLPRRQYKAKTLAVIHPGWGGKDSPYPQDDPAAVLLRGMNQVHALIETIRGLLLVKVLLLIHRLT